MGGPGAPNDLEAGAVKQVWLAMVNDPEATVRAILLPPEAARGVGSGEGREGAGAADGGVREDFWGAASRLARSAYATPQILHGPPDAGPRSDRHRSRAVAR